MKEYTEKFDKGKERKRTKQAVSLEGKRHRILKKLKVVKDKNERSELIRQYKAYQKEGLQYSDGDEMDMNYRKLKYVRYADDFLIGIIGFPYKNLISEKFCSVFSMGDKCFLIGQCKSQLFIEEVLYVLFDDDSILFTANDSN